MDNFEKPTFVYHNEYFEGMKYLFEFYQAEAETQTSISSAILVKNSITLLNGTYGTGKTQLVNLIKRLFFNSESGEYDYDYETCHQDLTAVDVLYHLDLAELQKGKEVVKPKKIVKARLKFLNEIQRANPTLYNSLLPLLSERIVTYRDEVFHSPDFIMLMDQNPYDSASSEIPRAFFDRIDFIIYLPTTDLESSVNIFNKRNLESGIQWDSLEVLVDHSILLSSQIDEIWKDVVKVRIPKKELLLANLLIGSFSACIKTDRSLTGKSFLLDYESCKYLGEVCSHLIQVPGFRAINSTLKLAQARAWLSKRGEICFEDLLFCLPYTLAHRLQIKREELALIENPFEWVKKKALGELLNTKYDSWMEAIDALEDNDIKKIKLIAQENLVVGNLIN